MACTISDVIRQKFARKVMRVGGGIQMSEIQNEFRAAAKLCRPGAHENVVAVLRWGPLPGSPCHFIDMDLCEYNLGTYISYLSGEKNLALIEDKSRFSINQMWSIMSQIANGVSYIHSQGEIHRDLKPSNGNRNSIKLILGSSIL